MPLEVAEAEKELFKLIVYGHVNIDFKPVFDPALRLHGYPMGYSFPEDKEFSKKLFITDLDGVWNVGYPIFVGYLNELKKENTCIENEYNNILQIVQEMTPDNIEEPTNRISEIFRKCDVRKKQHDEACEHAADEIGLPLHGLECLAVFWGMHYDMYCFSGSPDGAVKEFVKRRMGLVPKHEDGPERGYGSVYNFESEDPNAKFVSIDPLLYKYKKPVVEKVVKEITGAKKFIGPVLTDEPGDIEMVGSIINTLIIVDSMEEFYEEKEYVIINLPKFGKDSRVLPPKLKKIERALCFFFGYTQEEKESIFTSALEFKKCTELIESTDDEELLRALKEKKLEYYKEYETVAQKIFPSFLSEIDSFERKFRKAATAKEIKSASHNFWNKYREFSPDSDIAEIYYKFREPDW